VSAGLSGQCHCGAIALTIPARPQTATLCNCSICRRLGALWAYFPVSAVRITGDRVHGEGYVQGDRKLRVVRCRHCGCVTHWEPLQPGADGRMAVNLRNFDPAALEGLQLRRFDGAVSWRYVTD
jgi:hypothetical protein